MHRWATEDPNPGEKIAEEKRIEEMGQKAISGMLDENLVEAAQTLRALEDGDEEDYYPIEPSRPEYDDDDEDADARPSKRIRNGGSHNHAETTLSRNGGQNNDADGDEHRKTAKDGLLGGDALDNIRFYAEMSRKQAEEDRKRQVPAGASAGKSKASGMALLGGYESGEESD